MEIIALDGYTEDEKLAIARGYLLPRQIERNGLRADEVTFGDDALRSVIGDYTREAGVRGLEREIGKVLRKAARRVAEGAEGHITIGPDDLQDALGRPKFHHEAAERTATPGVATGLAVTGAGGDVLFVEASATQADGPGDRLVLTGQLGDVMRESARIALSWTRSHGARGGHPPGRAGGQGDPRPHPGGGDPQGRAVGGRDDDHGHRVPGLGAAGPAERGDDRRGLPPGPGAADRRAQAEDPCRPPGRADRRGHPGAQPARPGRRAGPCSRT